MIDRRTLNEFPKRVMLLHVLSFHDDPIGQITSKVRRIRMSQHLLPANRLQPIRANDHVRVLIHTPIRHRKRRGIEIDGPDSFTEENLDAKCSSFVDEDTMEVGTMNVIVRCSETLFVSRDEVDARQNCTVPVRAKDGVEGSDGDFFESRKETPTSKDTRTVGWNLDTSTNLCPCSPH